MADDFLPPPPPTASHAAAAAPFRGNGNGAGGFSQQEDAAAHDLVNDDFDADPNTSQLALQAALRKSVEESHYGWWYAKHQQTQTMPPGAAAATADHGPTMPLHMGPPALTHRSASAPTPGPGPCGGLSEFAASAYEAAGSGPPYSPGCLAPSTVAEAPPPPAFFGGLDGSHHSHASFGGTAAGGTGWGGIGGGGVVPPPTSLTSMPSMTVMPPPRGQIPSFQLSHIERQQAQALQQAQVYQQTHPKAAAAPAAAARGAASIAHDDDDDDDDPLLDLKMPSKPQGGPSMGTLASLGSMGVSVTGLDRDFSCSSTDDLHSTAPDDDGAALTRGLSNVSISNVAPMDSAKRTSSKVTRSASQAGAAVALYEKVHGPGSAGAFLAANELHTQGLGAKGGVPEPTNLLGLRVPSAGPIRKRVRGAAPRDAEEESPVPAAFGYEPLLPAHATAQAATQEAVAAAAALKIDSGVETRDEIALLEPLPIDDRSLDAAATSPSFAAAVGRQLQQTSPSTAKAPLVEMPASPTSGQQPLLTPSSVVPSDSNGGDDLDAETNDAVDGRYGQLRSPMLLGHPDDREWLSDLLCFTRAQIEVFTATPSDVAARSRRGGIKGPIAVGRVGIRCRHCADVPPDERANGAVSYPQSIDAVHQSVRNWQRYHFDACPNMPPEVKEEKASMKEKRSHSGNASKAYWIQSCKRMGMIDTDREHGIRMHLNVGGAGDGDGRGRGAVSGDGAASGGATDSSSSSTASYAYFGCPSSGKPASAAAFVADGLPSSSGATRAPTTGDGGPLYPDLAALVNEMAAGGPDEVPSIQSAAAAASFAATVGGAALYPTAILEGKTPEEDYEEQEDCDTSRPDDLLRSLSSTLKHTTLM